MIILLASEADMVRGLFVLGHALEPVPLADGTFALPEAVLTDPHYEPLWPILRTFDIRLDTLIRAGEPLIPGDPSSPIINSDWEQDPTKRALCSYQSSWVVGERVHVELP